MNRSRLRNKKDVKRRLFMFFAVVLLFVFGVLGFQRQQQLSEYVSKVVEFTSLDGVEVVDPRGYIYDRNYQELAATLEKVSVLALTREIKDISGTALKLAMILEKDAEPILAKLKQDSHRVWIAENIDQEEEEAIKKLDLPGVQLNRQLSRYYPEQETASHVIGYSEGKVGLAGVELYYDKLKAYYRSSSSLDSKGPAPLQPGSALQHLVLTVDSKIQQHLELFVSEIVEHRSDVVAGACLLEAVSGAVIGYVNYPSYNPNLFREYDSYSLENRLLTPIAIPENMRKMLYDASVINSVDNLLPWPVLPVGKNLGGQLRLWDGLGLDAMTEVDFGGGITTGEKGDLFSLYSHEEKMALGTTPDMASPIQIASAFAALLNGGVGVTPYTVSQIVGEDVRESGMLLHDSQGKRVIEKNHAKEIVSIVKEQATKSAMHSMVISGKSVQYKSLPLGREYSRNQVMISPVPFDSPELLLLVFVQEKSLLPLEKHQMVMSEGQVNQSVKKILPSLAVLQQMMKNYSEKMTTLSRQEKNMPDSVSVEKYGHHLTSIEQTLEQVMPDLSGLSLRKSLRLLQGKGVDVRINGTGIVVDQSPSPGTALVGDVICQVSLEPYSGEVKGK